ncbi:MAG TPA: hypothetical protein PKC67_13550 [Kiritimatiellia bacterium]|nr:hypothetical protein [Kiritimatiellia bacterium]HMP35359.1 hypothetical protein [Kiritimatiellia bacterium]
MPAPDITYRETHRRSHRTLGVYLILQAWQKNVDCVAVPRGSLLNFLELTRMRNQRIDWIKDDIKDVFPYVWTTVSTGTSNYATAYFSRYPFPEASIRGSMTDVKRCEVMTSSGLKSAVIKVPKEKELLQYIALTSNGLISVIRE